MAPYDVQPGELIPADGWLELLDDVCRRMELDADDDVLAGLRVAHTLLVRGRLRRRRWLATVEGTRTALLGRMQAAVPAPSMPWSTYDRDLWLHRLQLSAGLTLKQLEAALEAHVLAGKLDWPLITTSRISEALNRVRDHLSVPKRGRGRPKSSGTRER